MEYIFMFILGVVLGSFYNVVGLRVAEGREFIKTPSKCINCNTRLKPIDLVPILSFTMLRGKCRYTL